MESNSKSSINGQLTTITTTTTKPPPNKTTTTVSVFRRRITLRRRRVLPSVRLGGKKPRRGLLLIRVLKRLKLRWMKLKNACTLKKLKIYYHSVVRDFIEGSATMEAFQQRLLMETSFAIPVMGLSFNAFNAPYP